MWPLPAASLGDDWASTFAAHRDGHEPVGALRDGRDPARALRDRSPAARTAADEPAGRESTMRDDGHSTPRPRRRARLRGLLRR